MKRKIKTQTKGKLNANEKELNIILHDILLMNIILQMVACILDYEYKFIFFHYEPLSQTVIILNLNLSDRGKMTKR